VSRGKAGGSDDERPAEDTTDVVPWSEVFDRPPREDPYEFPRFLDDHAPSVPGDPSAADVTVGPGIDTSPFTDPTL
jgi:hypothetical protein